MEAPPIISDVLTLKRNMHPFILTFDESFDINLIKNID